MAQELFSNIYEAVRSAFTHLTNANFETLIIVAVGIALLAYFVLRR
jgi:hypothetical protein